MLVTCQSLRILTTDLWGSLWISDWLPSACEPLSRHASVCCLCSCVWVSVVCVCFYLVRHLWVLLVGPNCWGHRIDLFVQGFINDRSVFQSNCTIIVAHPGKCVLTPMFIYGFLLLLIQWFAVVLFSQNQELELKYDRKSNMKLTYSSMRSLKSSRACAPRDSFRASALTMVICAFINRFCSSSVSIRSEFQISDLKLCKES